MKSRDISAISGEKMLKLCAVMKRVSWLWDECVVHSCQPYVLVSNRIVPLTQAALPRWSATEIRWRRRMLTVIRDLLLQFCVRSPRRVSVRLHPHTPDVSIILLLLLLFLLLCLYLCFYFNWYQSLGESECLKRSRNFQCQIFAIRSITLVWQRERHAVILSDNITWTRS